MESLARCLGDGIFSCSRGSIFSITFFYTFWAKYKFGLSIKTWRRGFGFLQLYFYVSKESHSVPDRDFLFARLLLILSGLELWRIGLPKLTSSILKEIVAIPIIFVDQFYF